MSLLFEVERKKSELKDDAYQETQHHRQKVIVICQFKVESEVKTDKGKDESVDNSSENVRRSRQGRGRCWGIDILMGLYLNHADSIITESFTFITARG